MPIIELSTVICAPRERVFDLARSIVAHQDSTGGTEERGVAIHDALRVAQAADNWPQCLRAEFP